MKRCGPLRGPLAPGFTAIVDGGAPDVEGRPPVIRVFRTGQVEPTIVPMPGRARRAMVFAWWTGTDVAVLSTPCPEWTDEVRPTIDLDQLRWLEQACGTAAVDLWRWSPTASWHQVGANIFQAPSGFNLSAPLGPRLVITIDEDPSSANPPVPVEERLLHLDAASGEVELLPPSGDFLRAAQVEPCQLRDGSLVAAVVPTEGVTVGPVEATPSIPQVQLMELGDTGWARTSIVTSSSIIGGCGADHRLVLVDGQEIVIYESLTTKPQRVAFPAGESVRIEEFGIGGIVALVNNPVGPGGVQAQQRLLLQGDRWREPTSVDPNDQSTQHVVDGHYFRLPLPSSASSPTKLESE